MIDIVITDAEESEWLQAELPKVSPDTIWFPAYVRWFKAENGRIHVVIATEQKASGGQGEAR